MRPALRFVRARRTARACAALAAGLWLAACGAGPDDEPATRLRVPLVAVASDGSTRPLDLVGHEIRRETRPALELAAGERATWRAEAPGHLRLGVAPGEGRDVVLRITAGGEQREHAVGGLPEWATLSPELRVAAGDAVEMAAEGEGTVWIADPVVASPGDAGPAPLVVMVLIDTIRADHTGLDGYGLPTSPNLDALAAEGAGFRRAYAPAPWTRPSVASLLTSLDPETHRTLRRNDRLAEAWATWPEMAREAGYQTVGVSTNPNVLPAWGFAQGFGRFVDLGAKQWLRAAGAESDAVAVFEEALAVLDAEPLPLFLYLHVLDPHHPYTPPLESARKVHGDFRPREPGQTLAPGASDAVVRSARRRYDGEIRHADEALGAFVAALRARGLWEQTALAVTGDHGEEFRERGGQYHGHTLYEEQIRVPLVLKLPGRAPAPEPLPQLVSIMDALPTLAAVAGWPAPPEIEGRSLLPVLERGEAVREELIASTYLDGAHAHAIVTPERKLIRTLAPERAIRVYDLAGDPGERAPRDDPEERERLERALDRRVAARRTGWHLRVCGATREATVAFDVTGTTGEPRAPNLEEGDRVAREGDRITVRVQAGTREAQRGWGATRRMERVPDEDEVVLAGGSLTLVPVGGETARLVVGDVEWPWRGAVTLDPAAARRAVPEAPTCDLRDRPTLLVWHVAEPASATVLEPDAELRRRLQELGYMLDDEPEGEAPEEAAEGSPEEAAEESSEEAADGPAARP